MTDHAPDMFVGRLCNVCGFKYHVDNGACAWCGTSVAYSEPNDEVHTVDGMRLQLARRRVLAEYPVLDRR